MKHGMFVAFFGYFVLPKPNPSHPCLLMTLASWRTLPSQFGNRQTSDLPKKSQCKFLVEWKYWQCCFGFQFFRRDLDFLEENHLFLSTEVDSVSAIIAQIPDLFLAWHLSLRSCKTHCCTCICWNRLRNVWYGGINYPPKATVSTAFVKIWSRQTNWKLTRKLGKRFLNMDCKTHC